MRRDPIGGAYERRGQFFIRITTGPQLRVSEHVPWAVTLEQATERARIIQVHVNRLRAANRADFVARVIEVYAKADEAKLASLPAAVEGMLEGSIVKASTASSLLSTETDAWLAATSNLYDPRTTGTFRIYARHWVRFFTDDVRSITAPRIKEYINERLGKVLRLTLKKELWGLRTFVTWAVDASLIPKFAEWPTIPKKVTGTRSGKQRAKIVELSQEDVERLLAVMPEHVRPRYTFAAETGLRPSTVDQIAVPEHYTPGSAMLSISANIDKNRYVRKVPLTDRARAILDAAAPKHGPIFGPERFVEAFKASVLLAGLPKQTAPYDLRHARATHDIEAGDSILDVAFMLGHKDVATTTKVYVHPNERSATAAIARRNARTSLVGNPAAAAAAASVAEGRLTVSQRRESPRRRAEKARSGTSTAMCTGSSPVLRTSRHLDAIAQVSPQELPPRPPPGHGGNLSDNADHAAADELPPHAVDVALRADLELAKAEDRFDDAKALKAVLDARAKARFKLVAPAVAKKSG